jgi:hypothetical protein
MCASIRFPVLSYASGVALRTIASLIFVVCIRSTHSSKGTSLGKGDRQTDGFSETDEDHGIDTVALTKLTSGFGVFDLAED